MTNIFTLIATAGSQVPQDIPAAGTGALGNAAGQAGGFMSAAMTFLPMVLVIGLLYFMMIRPQRKRDKELKDKLSTMKVGDKVTTIGGVVGKITKIKDDFVIIETGNIGTPTEVSYLRFERGAIKEVATK